MLFVSPLHGCRLWALCWSSRSWSRWVQAGQLPSHGALHGHNVLAPQSACIAAGLRVPLTSILLCAAAF